MVGCGWGVLVVLFCTFVVQRGGGELLCPIAGPLAGS